MPGQPRGDMCQAFGYCCCTSQVSLSAAVAVAFGMMCAGLVVLSIFQMCWVIEMHAIGAFMFFVGGFSCICMANFSTRTPRSGNDWADPTPPPEDLPLTESLVSKAVRWGALMTFLVAFPLYAAGYGYTGEWFMVAAIALFVTYAYLTLVSRSTVDHESLTLDLDTKETQIAEANLSSSP